MQSRSGALMLCGLTLLSLALSGHSRQRKPPRKPDLRFAVDQVSLDDALLQAAEASGINFMADATHFPPANTLFSGQWRDWGESWDRIFEGVAESRDLSVVPYSKTMVLWWQQPTPEENVALGRQLATQTDLLARALPGHILIDDEFYAVMVDYLRETKQWQEEPPPVLDICLSNLPADLREEIIKRVQSREQIEVRATQGTLNDKFWQNAFICIETDRLSPKPFDLLKVGGAVGDIGVFKGLSIVKQTRDGKWVGVERPE